MKKETLSVNGLLISKFMGVNVNYDTAKAILAKAGHGWRIPTLAEFFEIRANVSDGELDEWFGANWFSMIDIFVQSIDNKDDINTISLDGQHLSCNVLKQVQSSGLVQVLANVVLVKTHIGTRAYCLASRYANEAVEDIKSLLKSHNAIGLDFDKYRGKCRIEDYDYIVQTGYEYDSNMLCGIYIKDDNVYVAESNGNDTLLDTYRSDLEVDLWELVNTIFNSIDEGKLELYEYPEDNI